MENKHGKNYVEKKNTMSYVLTSSNPRSLRTFLLGKIALPSVLLYRNLFKRHKTAWGENRQSLAHDPGSSIGKAMSVFLYSNEIDLEPKIENHDLFHVVLGYNTTLPEEAALHFYLIGNGKGSHYPFIAALVGFLFFPEYYDLYIDAYHRGRHCQSFVGWELKEHLSADLSQFQQSVKLPPRRC
jgi:hypothetical protein